MDGTTLKVWSISDEATRSDLIAEHAIKHDIFGRCSWSPDGEWIAFGETNSTRKVPGENAIIHVWNAHTMIEHRVYSQFESSADILCNMDFSPDSRWLTWIVLDKDDHHYSAWNVGTDPDEPPRRVPTKPGPALGQFMSVSFDPQSKRTVSVHWEFPNGEMDCSVRVWDNETGELLASMGGHSERATHASFSPDGRQVLSASMDGTAKVWDAESGVCLLSLDRHGAGLTKAIYSPDGCYIATASEDETVRLWRGDGMCLATFAEHTTRVTDLAFSPDGHTLASGDGDGIVHIRDLGGLIPH